MPKLTRDTDDQIVAENRKARHDYHLLEEFEAGLALQGTEVKAAREGRIQLRDSYCRFDKGEAYLYGAHIDQVQPRRITRPTIPRARASCSCTRTNCTSCSARRRRRA